MLAQIQNTPLSISSIDQAIFAKYVQQNRLYELTKMLFENAEFLEKLSNLDESCEKLLENIVDLAIEQEEFFLVTNLLFLIYSQVIALALKGVIDSERYQGFVRLKSKWFIKYQQLGEFIEKSANRLLETKGIGSGKELAAFTPWITGLYTRFASMSPELRRINHDLIEKFAYFMARIFLIFKEEIATNEITELFPLWRLITDFGNTKEIDYYLNGDFDIIYMKLRQKLKLPRKLFIWLKKNPKK